MVRKFPNKSIIDTAEIYWDCPRIKGEEKVRKRENFFNFLAQRSNLVKPGSALAGIAHDPWLKFDCPAY